MPRLSLITTLSLVLLFSLLAAACSDDVVAPTAPPADDPNPTIPPTMEVTPSPEPEAEVERIDDPVEFVLAYNERIEDGDWDAVRAMVIEEFREFGDDVLRAHLPLTMPRTDEHEPVDWQAEQHEHFTVVRIAALPVFAIVLRETDEEGWLVDPGPYTLTMAEFRAEGVTSWGLPSGRTVEFEREGLDPGGFMPLVRVQRDNFDHIGIDAERVLVTMSWMFTHRAEGEFPVDGVSWSAGGESGAAEIYWTTARIEGASVVFPMPEEAEEIGATSYRVSFALDGVPEVDTFELRIDDITISIPDDDDIDYSITYQVPREEFPQPLRAGLPEVEGTQGTQDLEPADAPSISVAGIDTTVENGLTEVLIELRTDPSERVELVSDPLVVWSDGEVTGAGQPGGTAILVLAERQDVPEGIEPVEVRIPHLSRELPADPDAVFHTDRIETRWGTFMLGELVEQPGGGWSSDYLGVGTRTLASVRIEHDGAEIVGSGTSATYEPDFTVRDARIDFVPEFGEVRDSLPLTAEVVVREIAEEIVVDLAR